MFGKKSTEIIKVEPAPGQSALDQLLADPERLKEYPIETVERMFELTLKLKAEEARREFAEAFNAVQSELAAAPVRKLGRNTQTGSMYARAEEVMEALDPIITKHGFSRSTSTEESAQPDTIRFVLILRHAGGHSERHFLDAPNDSVGPKGNPTKTKLHGMASSYSFCERHLCCKVFGLRLTADDDGNAGSGVGPSAECITEHQAADLSALIDEVEADLQLFLDYFRVKTLGEMLRSQFQGAVRLLEQKRRS